jgi:serine/threonine protein kinase
MRPLPESYIPLTSALDGTTADVIFCWPKTDKNIAAQLLVEENIQEHLVAVKISKLTANASTPQVHEEVKEFLPREITALKRIRARATPALQRHLPLLLDYDDPPETSGGLNKWIALQALYPGVTLKDFIASNLTNKGSTNELSAHCFLQIGQALQFLHQDLKICHRDVHHTNIMLRRQSPPSQRLPDFVLIDFEQVLEFTYARGYTDMSRLCSVVLQLAGERETCDDMPEPWDQFVHILQQGEIRRLPRTMKDLMKLCTPHITKILSSMANSTVMHVQSVFGDVFRCQGESIVGELSKFVAQCDNAADEDPDHHCNLGI